MGVGVAGRSEGDGVLPRRRGGRSFNVTCGFMPGARDPSLHTLFLSAPSPVSDIPRLCGLPFFDTPTMSGLYNRSLQDIAVQEKRTGRGSPYSVRMGRWSPTFSP